MKKDELEEKFKNLGIHFGSRYLAKPSPKIDSNTTIENGTISENRMGKFFYIDNKFGSGYKHGNVNFCDILDQDLEFNLPDLKKNMDWKNCIFLDTETTGLSLSAGTFAFMVGVAKIECQSVLLRQYFLKSPSEEAAMLLDLSNFIPNDGCIVSYNGISFDVPILQHRYVLHKMPSDINRINHLDLLKYSRALWRFQFNDRSLKSIEEKILKFTRTTEEIPGWMAPEIYRDFLKTGNFASINGVFYHNAMDVISLCALLSTYIRILNSNEVNIDQFDTLNFAIGRLHEKNNNLSASIRYYQETINQKDASPFVRIKAIVMLSLIYKKAGNYNEAVVLWEMGSELEEMDCVIELAKYYEHKMRNYKDALYWVEFGLQITTRNKNLLHQAELTHRQTRLMSKLEKE